MAKTEKRKKPGRAVGRGGNSAKKNLRSPFVPRKERGAWQVEGNSTKSM